MRGCLKDTVAFLIYTQSTNRPDGSESVLITVKRRGEKLVWRRTFWEQEGVHYERQAAAACARTHYSD